MNRFVVPGVVGVVGVALIIVAVISMRRMVYPNKTQEQCNLMLEQAIVSGAKKGEECAMWYGSQCRKGEFDGAECISKGSVVPLLSGGLGVVAIIAAIVLLIMRRKSNTP